MQTFDLLESEVRGYCRSWPVVFSSAEGCTLVDEHGRHYVDFFAGAGALNYGHNHPALIESLLGHLARNGVVHGLDMATTTKRDFLVKFDEMVLKPRGLEYKLQFPGPTGTNAVEAALKLARKVTGREAIINFTNSFHGMTLGALSVTGNSMKRAGAGIPLVHATPMPYDNYFGGVTEDFQWMERVLVDSGSGMNRPAAVIVESVQGEGGINAARAEWLQELDALPSSSTFSRHLDAIANALIELEVIDGSQLKDLIEKIEGEPLPDLDGLSVESRRLINTATIALAQHLLVHFAEHDLAHLAKAAIERPVGEMRFGERRDCDRMVERIRERMQALKKQNLAELVRRRTELLSPHLRYRDENDNQVSLQVRDPERVSLFIDGEFTEGTGEEVYELRSPVTGEHIANVPLLEEGRREAQQMAHQVADDLKQHHRAEDAQDPCPERFEPCVHDRERAEPEGQNRKQITIRPPDGFVHHELYLKGQRKGGNLEGNRQPQNLKERRPEAGQA